MEAYLKMTPKPKQKFIEKYFICPSCGELSTESQQIENMSQSGMMPYCYCEFDNGRIFIGYKRINKNLWQELKKLKTDKLRLKAYRKYKLDKIRSKK